MTISPSSPTFRLYADGAISDSSAGAGVVGLDSNGEVIALANRAMPPLTSTQAEYAALILALEVSVRLSSRHAAAHIELHMDSEVVVHQMNGRYAVNSASLKAPHRTACELARQLPHIVYKFVPRLHNRLADALAAEAILGRRYAFER